MRIKLTGPDDLGFWFVADEKGRSFPLVERHEDHPKGAAFLGWNVLAGVADQEAIIDSALDWLMVHTGEVSEVPPQVAKLFRQLNEDNEEKCVRTRVCEANSPTDEGHNHARHD